MAQPHLIDTLEFGPENAPECKYEIYGEDDKQPQYATRLVRDDNGEWQPQQDEIRFAAQQEQQAASSTMDYGYSDGAPELRDPWPKRKNTASATGNRGSNVSPAAPAAGIS